MWAFFFFLIFTGRNKNVPAIINPELQKLILFYYDRYQYDFKGYKLAIVSIPIEENSFVIIQ